MRGGQREPAVRSAALLLGVAAAGLLAAQVAKGEATLTVEQRARAQGAGGALTVYRIDTSAFSLPAPNLSLKRRTRFFAGNSFFTQPWVPGPASTSARDGLGPLFNTNTCQSCHLKDGRGRPPEPGQPMTSMLVRVSVRSNDGDDAPETSRYLRARLQRVGVREHPVYGDQIQTRAVRGVAPEAEATLRWNERSGRFADGTRYQLLEPRLELRALAYGELDEEVQRSARVAPALVGMGLLEAIPEAEVLARADPEDSDGDGISGRVNWVWDVAQQRMALGRFGWKAGQPSVRQQVAAAFAGDLGITSRWFPNGSCPPVPGDSGALPDAGSRAGSMECGSRSVAREPELSEDILDLVTFYVSTLGVPARRATAAVPEQRGRELFRELGCAGCHVEQMTTADGAELPELRGQRIQPYSDLLLHDMGEGLADHRSEFTANGREWRTPPLWGIGLVEIVSRHTRFLHDGRARDLEEAILWHGGEAHRAAEAYRALPAQRREQLLFFLRSL